MRIPTGCPGLTCALPPLVPVDAVRAFIEDRNEDALRVIREAGAEADTRIAEGMAQAIRATRWDVMSWPRTDDALARRHRVVRCDTSDTLHVMGNHGSVDGSVALLVPCCGVAGKRSTRNRVRAGGAVQVPDAVSFALAYLAMIHARAREEWWYAALDAAYQDRQAAHPDAPRAVHATIGEAWYQKKIDAVATLFPADVWTVPVGSPTQTPRWWAPWPGA